MQSGTTGINTLRIYSPTKQAKDHDPDGRFIRQWVPELKRVPLPYLAEPWTMPDSVQHLSGCTIGSHYPVPIVDDKAALQLAKLRMVGLRQTPEAKAEASNIQMRHGSRKSGLPPSGQRRTTKREKQKPDVPDAQGDLFESMQNE